MKKTPIRVRTLQALRDALLDHRRAGRMIGFVPTMGALHDGHVSLVRTARAKCDVTVGSIFVNPTQFAPGEDLETYPRTEESDIARLEAGDTDSVYLPDVAEMYPEGSKTNVGVAEMSDVLDGIFRPHFFYGVATVVARLFIHVQPDLAVFGVIRAIAGMDTFTDVMANTRLQPWYARMAAAVAFKSFGYSATNCASRGVNGRDIKI